MKKKYDIDWKEAITPIFFLLITISYIIQVRDYITDLTYPLFVIVVSVVLLIVTVFKYVIKPYDESEAKKKSVERKRFDEIIRIVIRDKRVQFFAIIFLYFFLIQPLGFIVANVLLMLAMLWFMNGKKFNMNHLVISLFTGIAIYLVFVVFMRYPLPTGIFGI